MSPNVKSGEDDSGPFPHTSDLYWVHIVAMLSGNYGGNINREWEAVPVRCDYRRKC